MNVFTTPGLCVVTGTIRKSEKQPNANQFSRRPDASLEAEILAFRKHGITIPTKDEEDRSKAIRGRRIGV
jgi:hypothetical protein